MNTPDLLQFRVPDTKTFQGFQIDKLTAKDAKVDFEALQSNAETIRQLLQIDWPVGDETFEGNLADIKRHEQEFDDRESFTYGIWDPQHATYLGCLYFYFEDKPWFQDVPGDCDCVVEFWVIESVLKSGLYKSILDQLKRWIKDEWPVKKVWFVNDRSVVTQSKVAR